MEAGNAIFRLWGRISRKEEALKIWERKSRIIIVTEEEYQVVGKYTRLMLK